MTSMTPPTDKPSQKQLHLVLGDLLDLRLPEIDWSLNRGQSHLAGFVNHRHPRLSDEEAVRIFTPYVRLLGEAPHGFESGAGVHVWNVEGQFEGIDVRVYCQVSLEYGAEHEAPQPALPPRADTYVRRSNGQLAEVVK